jgi:hypothetical protein
MQNDRLTMTFAVKHFYDFIVTLKHNGDIKKNQGCYCQRKYIRYNAEFIKAVEISGLPRRRHSMVLNADRKQGVVDGRDR